jgi:hypothetical protein
VVVALVVAALVCASAAASAHRHDELLQAARIGIDTQSVELELALTPGIAQAGSIIDEIDRNDDGALAEQEKSAYARRVLSAIQLAVDGRSRRIELVESSFPTIDALRRGDARIDLRAASAFSPLAPGKHEIAFSNAYRPDIAVYLTNALAPANDRIAIVLQRRDPDQRSTTIEYEIASRDGELWPLIVLIAAASAWAFIRRPLFREARVQ